MVLAYMHTIVSYARHSLILHIASKMDSLLGIKVNEWLYVRMNTECMFKSPYSPLSYQPASMPACLLSVSSTRRIFYVPFFNLILYRILDLYLCKFHIRKIATNRPHHGDPFTLRLRYRKFRKHVQFHLTWLDSTLVFVLNSAHLVPGTHTNK